jgi:predicted Zn-dependent protease
MMRWQTLAGLVSLKYRINMVRLDFSGSTSMKQISQAYGESHIYSRKLRLTISLLALAGFDPRAAVSHFSESVADLHEIQPLDKEKDDTLTRRLFKLWTENTHPSAEQRVAAIKQELDRWDWPAASGVSRDQ